MELPANLKSLSFGWRFNQSLEHVRLPAGLRHLSFGENFNESLERVKLPQLETLSFGEGFNQAGAGCQKDVLEDLARVALPSSLRSLSFGRDFNRRLSDTVLPEKLQVGLERTLLEILFEGAVLWQRLQPEPKRGAPATAAQPDIR